MEIIKECDKCGGVWVMKKMKTKQSFAERLAIAWGEMYGEDFKKEYKGLWRVIKKW